MGTTQQMIEQLSHPEDEMKHNRTNSYVIESRAPSKRPLMMEMAFPL